MNTKRISVSVVIPNYNGEDLLRKNLPYVIEAKKNKVNNIDEIIVIDDASTDGSVALLKESFPEVRVIKHRINRKFSAAVNTGARSSKGNLICLLNSDVMPENNFLEAALPHFENEKVFGVSLAEKGYSWARGFVRGGFVVHEPGKRTENAHETFWLSGGSSIFRRDLWMKLKGMDEKLYPPFYWEDLDLSYRAMKRGWLLLWEPKAKVIHEHESTNRIFAESYRSRIQERNQLLFIWKNLTSPNLFRKHVIGLIRRVIKHPGYLRIVTTALVKIPLVMRLRNIEKKETTVSDESIFARFS